MFNRIVLMYTDPHLVLVKPADDFIAFIQNLLFVLVADLASKFLILHSGLHIKSIGLQAVLSRHLVTLHVILGFVFLSFLDHALYVVLAESTFS